MEINIWDIILSPFYLMVIFFISRRTRNKNIENNPGYRYYLPGLWLKIICGISLSLIYIYYFKGGDTISYFYDTKTLGNVLFENPREFFKLMLNGTNNNFYYSIGTKVITFEFGKDAYSFFFVRLITPITFLAFQNALITVILLAWISYIGVWKLYSLFCEVFPKLYKELSYAIVFVPSLALWGSGILKDTVTTTACFLFVFYFYRLFIKKPFSFKYFLYLILCGFVLISIKPYIIIALIPACLIWFSVVWTRNIENVFLRVISTPTIIVFGITIAIFILSLLGSSLGKYASKESILKKAQETQQDLINAESYSENYFDIGKFDNTVPSVLSKAPAAITAGLFRPFIWEARNPLMIASGIESFCILLLSIVVLFFVGPIKIIRNLFKEPIIFFSLVFAIIFAFSVGLTTANFGALVRYRIPAIPFYICFLIVILSNNIRERNSSKMGYSK